MFRPKIRRLPLLLTIIATIVAMVLLLRTPHRMRLAVGTWRMNDAGNGLEFSPQRLSATNTRYPWRFSVATGTPDTGTFRAAVALVREIEERPGAAQEAPHAMLDDPDSSLTAILEGRQLHCYNVDLAVTVYLGRRGIYARVWDLDGTDGIGGNGHNLLEVWDSPRGAWLAFDPYYRCYFTADSSSDPIGVVRLRSLLLTEPARVQVQHFDTARPRRAGDDIRAEFQQLAPLASLHANNAYRWRYDHRFGVLQFMHGIFDALPLRYSRGMRTLMLGSDDARYVIRDRYTPPYAFERVSLLFRLLLLVAVVLLALDVLLGLRERLRARRRRRSARANPTASAHAL
jgi:hypothetical protein